MAKRHQIDLSEDIEKYIILLRDLCESRPLNIYEYACALLRVGGLEDAGWDPLIESKEFLQDIIKLTHLDFDKSGFSNGEKTQVRLMLLGYAHLIEMDAPYSVIANLLGIRAKKLYCWDPYWDIREKKKGKKKEVMDLVKGPVPVYPAEKIVRIKSLASKVRLPEVGLAFDDFYYPVLRNAIDHSDYVLHNNEMRLLKGRIKNSSNTYTPIIPYDTLFGIIKKAYAFYWSFFSLEYNARCSFRDLKGVVFPFHGILKGLLEFNISEDGVLSGVTVHWPNKLDSYFVRTEEGCKCCNIHLGKDLAVDFFVGEYFKPHSPFSSLVQLSKDPIYAKSVHNHKPLEWSEKPYQL